MTFSGPFRGTPEQEHHLHESPASMTIPLMILAVGAAGAGFLGVPSAIRANSHAMKWWLTSLFPELPHVAEAAMPRGVELGLMVVSVAVALVGIVIAWKFYTGMDAFAIAPQAGFAFSRRASPA